MVRATPARVCSPPVLPEYLKNVYDLKPISGVPTDDEVKAVHAVIRAAQTVSQVPGMFDPELSMNLAQHLFEVQMGTVIDILADIVHTPPSLPSHVPTSLKPIRGVPSDEELQSVHAATRFYDQMSIIPSMFDPNVGMELSQHLFNIQFTRYMDQAPRGKLASKFAPRPSVRAQPPVDPEADSSGEKIPVISEEARVNESTGASHPAVQARLVCDEGPSTIIGNDSQEILDKFSDTVEVVKTLVSCQQFHARFIRSFYETHNDHLIGFYEVMNKKGQLPTSQGLPLVDWLRVSNWPTKPTISNSQLARYLQFYGIGSDLVDEGDMPTIKVGQGEAANTLLLRYLRPHSRWPPNSPDPE